MQYTYSLELLFSIITFTLAMTITPGPNNIMLLSSGVTYGYKKTLPHITGIVLGFTLMVICIGLGVGTLFERYPSVFIVLKYIGICYLFWMAWRIANTKGHINTKSNKITKPFSFLQGAFFQLVNPKAWIVAITSILSFTTNNEKAFDQVLVIAFIFMISGIISCNLWTLGGVILQKFIKDDRHVKIFNVTMAVLIVASILPVIIE